MRRREFLGLVGMRAHGGVNPVVLLGKRNRRIQLFRTRPRADGQKSGYARGARAVEHGIAILRKLRKINMRVRINQFHLFVALPFSAVCVMSGVFIPWGTRSL